MIGFPNAKINIGLFITEKRTDGFHNLETIFYPINAAKDILEILPAEQDEITFLGIPIPGDASQNLVSKALNLIRNDYAIARQPVRIILYKNIPMGAGLGGGSADAAFALTQLTAFFNISISQNDLLAYALQLGSDCPFFIVNTPSFASGRGELLEKVSLDLSAYSIQLICPALHINTAQAFAGIQPKAAPIDLRNIARIPISDWKDVVLNDFEQTIFPIHSALRSIKSQMYEQGALYASLSGTGSTVYGIFPKMDKATIQLEVPFQSFYQE